MNYDEAKVISMETSKDHFDVFLKMNLVFIEDKSTVKNPIIDIDKEGVNELYKSIEENKALVEEAIEIDNNSQYNDKFKIGDNEIKEAKGEVESFSTELENKGVFEQVKDFLKKKFDKKYINK